MICLEPLDKNLNLQKLEEKILDFWKNEDVTEKEMLQINMDIFVKRSHKILNYKYVRSTPGFLVYQGGVISAKRSNTNELLHVRYSNVL